MKTKEVDIVVIGSGASGGVIARELSPLCDDGVRIAVLEWGPRFKKEEFTGREVEMANRLYFDGGGFFNTDRNITIAMGKAYGGSTVVYTGTTFVIPEKVLQEWDVPGLTFQEMQRRSKKYFEECNVTLTPPELINDNNRLFHEACTKLGYDVEKFPVNIKGCDGSGLCNLGCPNEAKMGTHVVQLPQAQSRGVEVVTNCQVERIGQRSCRAVVRDPGIGHPSPWEPGEYEVRAKVVIVCAGAVHTPALLQHSGLGTDLPTMGRYVTLHPALILVGQHDRPLTNFYGHPKCYFSDHFVASHGFIMETCMYFPFMTAKSMSGFGAEHAQMMQHMDRLQQVLVMAFDKAVSENRITADKQGNPQVHYTLSERVLDSFFTSMAVVARVLFASGAKRVHAPAGVKFFIEAAEQDRLDQLMSRDRFKPGKVSISSAHIMGGCRMGQDRATSVTNPFGQVHGHPWLFVADASLFPRCSEVNPYITIMALADRVAEHVRNNARELLNP